jgi:hypothetical protein
MISEPFYNIHNYPMQFIRSSIDFTINNWLFLSVVIPTFLTGLGIMAYGFWCMYRDSREYRL